MLSRHGAISTARSLSRGTSRAFTTGPSLCLPRKRPGADKKPSPESIEQPLEPQIITYVIPKPVVARPILGLLQQQARLEESIKRRLAYAKGRDGSKELIQGTQEHNDLASFLAFAEKKRLDTKTTVYKGTHYEYTVMESLKQFGFVLHRTGKSNDKGIDLLGHWRLPGKPYEIKVLVQCKVSRGMPSTIREMEGAYAGAPSEWQGDNVLALLASSKALTKGVLEGVQRSPSSLGALHVETDGLARQFIWNSIAGERGLSGIGVTTKYQEVPANTSTADTSGAKQTVRTVALTWKGQPFIAKMSAN
jgi:hypothetical protein